MQYNSHKKLKPSQVRMLGGGTEASIRDVQESITGAIALVSTALIGGIVGPGP